MKVSHSAEIRRQIQESARVKQDMLEACSTVLEQAAEIMITAVRNGNKILWCGNGGSAADSQHLSTELLARLRHTRPPIPSLALTTDSSLLTAWTNDAEFDTVFSRQVEALGKPGDVLVGITTSGNSNNVLQAVHAARIRYLEVIVFTGGDGGQIRDLGTVTIIIPSRDTQRIQEGHILAGHILCDLVERAVLE